MGRSSVVDRIIELDSMTGADSSDPRMLNGPSSAFIGFLETHKDLPDPFFSPSPEGHVITGWDLDGLMQLSFWNSTPVDLLSTLSSQNSSLSGDPRIFLLGQFHSRGHTTISKIGRVANSRSMAFGDPLPNTDNVARYCQARDVTPDGTVRSSAFRIKGQHSCLSVNWMEYGNLPDEQSRLAMVRKDIGNDMTLEKTDGSQFSSPQHRERPEAKTRLFCSASDPACGHFRRYLRPQGSTAYYASCLIRGHPVVTGCYCGRRKSH